MLYSTQRNGKEGKRNKYNEVIDMGKLNCSKKCSNIDHINCSGKRQYRKKCECVCHKINDHNLIFTDERSFSAPLIFAVKSGNLCYFWCNRCETWHIHGNSDGHRVSHCNKYEHGYFLKIVGKLWSSDTGGYFEEIQD